MAGISEECWAQEFLRYRQRLLSLAERNLNPVLRKRLSPEDLVSDTLADACSKIAFFENEPEVPVYFKLRKFFFQALADAERKHLQAGKRDAYKEVDPSSLRSAVSGNPDTMTAVGFDRFAATMTGAATLVSRKERAALLRQALASLSDSDSQIIGMRHFDDMDNTACAEALGLTPKAASIRYVRALERLQRALLHFTEFKA